MTEKKTNGARLMKQDPEFHIKSQQHLATNVPLGQRFPSFKIINHCDARFWHFAKLLKADGRFHIVLFAGDVSKKKQMQRVHSFARALANMSIPLLQYRIAGSGQKVAYSISDILTIHSAPRQQVEYPGISTSF